MRNLEEIQKEYQTLCARAGDMQYKIFCFKADLDSLNKKLIELNQEAIKLKESQDGQTSSSPETGSGEPRQDPSEASVPASVG
jgi:predicted  nucleic acid-binding Zn-ribbon protein